TASAVTTGPAGMPAAAFRANPARAASRRVGTRGAFETVTAVAAAPAIADQCDIPAVAAGPAATAVTAGPAIAAHRSPTTTADPAPIPLRSAPITGSPRPAIDPATASIIASKPSALADGATVSGLIPNVNAAPAAPARPTTRLLPRGLAPRDRRFRLRACCAI